jgi:thymidine kinase
MGNDVGKETHEYSKVTQVQSNLPLDLPQPSQPGLPTESHTSLVRELPPGLTTVGLTTVDLTTVGLTTMDSTTVDPYTNPCFCTRSNHDATLELHQALGARMAPLVPSTRESPTGSSGPPASDSTWPMDLADVGNVPPSRNSPPCQDLAPRIHPTPITDPHPPTSPFALPSPLPQLHFYCGCMGSGKSTKLIIDLGTYERHHARSCVIKPSLDTRCERVQSRIPSLSRKGDVLLSPQDDLDPTLTSRYTRIFVDEAQFLTAKQVAQLWSMSLFVPVVAYGLKTDFQGHFFEGSQRLMELADRVIWMPSICARCGCDAVWNVRLSQNQPVFHGAIIQVGSDESYEAWCKRCISLSLLRGWAPPPPPTL